MADLSNTLTTTDVSGSHGTVRVLSDGTVQSCDCDEYSDIICVDLAEFRQFYGYTLNYMPPAIGILDVGYWYDNGSDDGPHYEPAVPEHRKAIRAHLSMILPARLMPPAPPEVS